MSNLLLNNLVYEGTTFELESELEKAVIANKDHIFGDKVVYFDYKRKTGHKDSSNNAIPDGFLIDFSSSKSPKIFFVEYELESHDLNSHVGPQIMKFYASFGTSKRQLHKKLIDIVMDDSEVKQQLMTQIKATNFDNVDSLFNHVIFDNTLGIILIIDNQTEDLNALLKQLSEQPEVIQIKKFVSGDETVYQFDPFREGLIDEISTKEKSHYDADKIDTIVCPAREEGFKHAFIDNDAWWEIRIWAPLIPKLKYIAMYETHPARIIQWVAKIKNIEPYKNTGKYKVNVEDKKKIGPIILDQDKKGVAPQSPRYTTYEKVLSAKHISELW